MNVVVQHFAKVFGMCVITVGLFSGCATQINPNRVPMSTVDLNHFQTDCRYKEQQVAMLQSMRQNSNDIFAARMRAMVQPFRYTHDHDIAHGDVNRYINFHLRHLSYCQ